MIKTADFSRRLLWIALTLLLLLASVGLLWREQSASSAADTELNVSFSLPPGRYDEDISLMLQTPNAQARIYYTLDGSTPDPQTAAVYSEPLALEASEPQVIVVRAQAFLPEGSSGPAAGGSFIMGLDSQLPILSIAADPGDLWDAERGIYVNHERRGRDWERAVDLTYAEPDGANDFHVGAGLRVHGGWTRYFYDKKSLRLYFREEYGAPKLNSELFGAEGQTAFDHLYLNNNDMDLLLFRNLLAERLFTQMGGYAVRGKPVLLFLNGRPWGIYTLRERIDERFLRQNYGVPEAAISDTPNNIGQQTAEQLATDLVHWQNVMRFVAENDLADGDNYDYLRTQVDIDNFVDYYLLQMYIANVDWPHHNVHQFRPWTPGGRWEWIIWDNNMAFDRADRQMVDHVLQVEHPLGDGMELFLNKLLANPEFRNLFLTRAADLLNTTLSEQRVTAEVERALAEFAADVPLEKARWNVPVEWQQVESSMREFADQRTGNMRSHFVESFGLAGTAVIAVEQDGGPQGWLAVNDLAPAALPWQGEQFAGSTIRLRAIPPAGYAFLGWEGYDGPDDPASAAITVPIAGSNQLLARFAPLPAGAPRPRDVVISAVHVDDSGEISGDWLELQVMRRGGVDLRGWRLTDNDMLTATDEGSLLFTDDPLLANLQQGDTVRVIATRSAANDALFENDSSRGGVLTLYAGSGRLDDARDPWFNLGPKDNLLLLAPGPTEAFADDIPIDFWSANRSLAAWDFGLPPAQAETE